MLKRRNEDPSRAYQHCPLGEVSTFCEHGCSGRLAGADLPLKQFLDQVHLDTELVLLPLLRRTNPACITLSVIYMPHLA